MKSIFDTKKDPFIWLTHFLDIVMKYYFLKNLNYL